MMAVTRQIDVNKLLEVFFPKKMIRKRGHTESPKDFRLPIRWDGKDFYKELYLLLKEYRIRIENRLSGDEYADYREDIKKVCYGVSLAVSESFRGNPHEAYNAVDKVLKLLTEKYESFIGEDELKSYPLYRAVDVKNKAKQDRKRVFHVPFNLRSKMSTTRYSIPGYPALYLGTSIALNCEEIHKSFKDDTVMAAKFIFNDADNSDAMIRQFQRKLSIIDLSVKPQDFQKTQQERKSPRLKSLTEHILRQSPTSYLVWYPLIAACSFIRVYREDPYSPEYIVPQLVTQWAKKMEALPKKPEAPQNDKRQSQKKRLCGVCYFSCLSERASEEGLNFAFPSSGSDIWVFNDLINFCPILAANFWLTEPIFVSEYQNPVECEKALNIHETAQVGKFNRVAIKNNKGRYIIPDGEDYIPDYTFADCNKLTSIDIPDNVTIIGNWAFLSCTVLTTINIPEGATSIGNWAFSNCVGLPSIKLPNSITSIGVGVFNNCIKLTNINIPHNVTSIKYATFNGCIRLTNIDIPTSLLSIEDMAFSHCTELPNINIPDSVTNIGFMAFSGCTGLTNITIPNSVTSIGAFAFNGCTKLNISVPSRFKNLKNHAFDGCMVEYYDP